MRNTKGLRRQPLEERRAVEDEDPDQDAILKDQRAQAWHWRLAHKVRQEQDCSWQRSFARVSATGQV